MATRRRLSLIAVLYRPGRAFSDVAGTHAALDTPGRELIYSRFSTRDCRVTTER